MAYTTIDKPNLHFNTKLYTGTGSTQSLTGVGFQPDMVWIKSRSGTTGHTLWDVVRGTTKWLTPNSNSAEGTYAGGLTSFDSDGFSIGDGGDINTNSATQVAWNWKAGNSAGSSNTDGSINTTSTSVNTTAGFSISTYTGNGTAGATVGHGLGAVPSMIIVKVRNTSNNWAVYHKDLGVTKAVYLDGDSAGTTDGWMNNTAPTNQVFYLSGGNYGNVNSNTHVAYCFAEKQGYSKFSHYDGNSAADGTFVYTGFKPAFLMIKPIDDADNWVMFDNKRDNQFNDSSSPDFLYANKSFAENGSQVLDFLSNGFKMRTTGNTANRSSTFIYMAFAENPMVGSNDTPATAR
jgi:hypothetical protein